MEQQLLKVVDLLLNPIDLSLKVEAGLLPQVSQLPHTPVEELDVVQGPHIFRVESNKVLLDTLRD